MKVFEVRTERFEEGSKEVIETVEYVTSKSDSLKAVVEWYTNHCEQYEKELLGVRYVLTSANNTID